MSMPEFVAAVEAIIEEHLNNIHTAVPAKITSIDIKRGLVSVKPLAQLKINEKVYEYPVINDVPLVMPSNSTLGIEVAVPIAVDDNVLLIFSEQALDYWRGTGTDNTEIKYGLSNAIAIPGLMIAMTDTAKRATEEKAIIIKSENNEIMLSKRNIAIRGEINVVGTLFINGKQIEP